jgi:biopolymer transport protein ExbB
MQAAAREGLMSQVWTGWPRLTATAARLALAACLLGAATFTAACLTPSVAAPASSKNALVYIAESCGWIFGPVFLLLSFIFVAQLVTCFMQIRKAILLPPTLSEQFEQHLEAKEYQPAYELAKNDDSYLGHVLAAGMGKLQSGYPAAVEAMENAQGEEQMKLEHKISYIALVGALAPMLGLLGTVQGMVSSFKTISDNPGVAPKPDQLATGIATALVTTLIGLWIAIPAIMFFQLLKNWLEEINSSAADESMRLMSRFQGMGKK